MMTWNPNNTVNQVTFTPSYFDGNAPFGNAGIIHWYAYRKVVGPTLSAADTEEDYVCLVLDQRLGDLCGWMGTRGYDSSWNGLTDWDHIGYPGDLGGGTRPSFQGSISIDNTIGRFVRRVSCRKRPTSGPASREGRSSTGSAAIPGRVSSVSRARRTVPTIPPAAGNYIPDMVNQARSDFP